MTPDPTLIEQERLIERLTKLYASLATASKSYDAEAVYEAIATLQGSAALPSEAITRIADKVTRQAECLVGYAEKAGHDAKPVPSIFHSQAMHFRDLADELRATTPTAPNNRSRYDSVDVGRYKGIDDTPTAPVQDDDAEDCLALAKRLRAPDYWMSGSSEGHEGMNGAPVEAAAVLERIASHLSPTPETGLVEAHDIALKSLRWSSNPALVSATAALRADGYNNSAGHLSNYMAGRFLDAYAAAREALSNVLPDEV